MLSILTLLALFGQLTAECPPTWSPLTDEQCYKRLKVKPLNFKRAQFICEQFGAVLPEVENLDQQNFLFEYALKHQQADDAHIWLGGGLLNDHFTWLHTNNVTYSNWDSTARKNPGNCLVMKISSSGTWIDVPCIEHHQVICQMKQPWSLEQMQAIILRERQQYTDMLTKLEEQIRKQLPVPLGFIYIQLAAQSDPESLWPSYTFEDITSQYSGLFFRAADAESAPFGTLQDDNAPHLVQVQTGELLNSDHPSIDLLDMVSGIIELGPPGHGTWSKKLFGCYLPEKRDSRNGVSYISFEMSSSGDAEVRPKNSAVKIWKRVK